MYVLEWRTDEKNDDLYTSSPCLTRSSFVLLMMSQSIADDVTMTRQLWRDHVKMIFNPSDIDLFTAILTAGRARNYARGNWTDIA